MSSFCYGLAVEIMKAWYIVSHWRDFHVSIFHISILILPLFRLIPFPVFHLSFHPLHFPSLSLNAILLLPSATLSDNFKTNKKNVTHFQAPIFCWGFHVSIFCDLTSLRASSFSFSCFSPFFLFSSLSIAEYESVFDCDSWNCERLFWARSTSIHENYTVSNSIWISSGPYPSFRKFEWQF